VSTISEQCGGNIKKECEPEHNLPKKRLADSVRFHGKYDLAPGSGGSSGLVLGDFP